MEGVPRLALSSGRDEVFKVLPSHYYYNTSKSSRKTAMRSQDFNNTSEVELLEIQLPCLYFHPTTELNLGAHEDRTAGTTLIIYVI